MGDVDVKYLRDKNVPQLLERLAAEIVTKRPADPEAFLAERFALGSDGNVRRGEAVKVYGISLDPATTAVLLAAGYAGVAVEYAEADPLRTGSVDINVLNPFGRAPVLEYHGTTVLEAAAIVRFLCNGTNALPLRARFRVRIESAFEVVSANVLPLAVNAANVKYFEPRRKSRPADNTAVTAVVERFTESLVPLMSLYFKEGVWLVGTEASVADLCLGAAVFTIQHVVGVDAMRSDGLKKWWDALQREPYFQTSLRGFAAVAAQAQRPAA